MCSNAEMGGIFLGVISYRFDMHHMLGSRQPGFQAAIHEPCVLRLKRHSEFAKPPTTVSNVKLQPILLFDN